ncbi:MAG: hypothetical protein HOO96_15780 [Polyangiaceae bacterium]|jgi:hypothetical protein|nr:hypothetical protein [Polyangiaceae bacterium]
MRVRSGLDKAITALSAAGGVAHIAFFSLFGYRSFAGSGFGRVANIVFAVLAGVGFVANFVGFSLVRHGGRWGAKKIGILSVALSTLIAAVLLAAASFLST